MAFQKDCIFKPLARPFRAYLLKLSIRITRVRHSSQLASILQRLERDLPLPDCSPVDRQGVSKRDASSAALTAVTPARIST
jgi:hypothetical protein